MQDEVLPDGAGDASPQCLDRDAPHEGLEMDHTKTHRLATSIAAAQWAAADRQRRARAAREAADEDATGQVPARASLRSRLRDLLRPATRRTV